MSEKRYVLGSSWLALVPWGVLGIAAWEPPGAAADWTDGSVKVGWESRGLISIGLPDFAAAMTARRAAISASVASRIGPCKLYPFNSLQLTPTWYLCL